MSELNWWGTRRHIDERSPLTPRLDRPFAEDILTFEPSQKLTVSMRGVMFNPPARDISDEANDVIIVTQNQFGGKALLTRLHFMKDNVPLGWQGSFFDGTILAVSDLRPEWRRLTVRLQAYDVDRIPPELFALVGGAAFLGTAIAFPQLGPFLGAGSTVLPALGKLISELDKHDEIIDQRLTLEISEANHGDVLLQPGYFVCFAEPQADTSRLYLNHQLRVLNESGEFKACSYAVIEIEPTFSIDREQELTEQAARLIAELDGKDATQSGIETLRAVMDSADNFDKLTRGHELIKKGIVNLTDTERDLVNELLNNPATRPFMPRA